MRFAGGLIEHECPRCHKEVALAFGTICSECSASIEKRAARAGRLIAGLSTIVMAAYVLVQMPSDNTGLIIGAASVAVWYMLSYLVVKRVARLIYS